MTYTPSTSRRPFPPSDSVVISDVAPTDAALQLPSIEELSAALVRFQRMVESGAPDDFGDLPVLTLAQLDQLSYAHRFAYVERAVNHFNSATRAVRGFDGDRWRETAIKTASGQRPTGP